MKKKIFVFPGVGSQHTGMGKEFYKNFNVVREAFEEAGDVLHVDFKELCFSETKKAELNKLENAQLALVLQSVATYRLYMEEVGMPPQYCMGHSLGEYSALCAAGVIQFPDALRIVKQRGIILNRIAAERGGMMAWVINLDNRIVERIAGEGLDSGLEIYVSAYDAPKQSSLSGSKDAVMTVGRQLEKEGAIVYPLRLSGPFHCPLMRPAEKEIRAILELYEYGPPVHPVIANHDTKLYGSGKESVITNLSLQLIKPICWQLAVEYILEEGVEFAVELGPDRVLKHLMQNNTDLLRTFSLANKKDLGTVKDSPVFSQ